MARHLGPLGVTVACEPGDPLTKDAGILLAEVVTVETRRGVTFVGLDIGWNVNCAYFIYGFAQEIVLCRDPAAERTERVTVAGHINEASDVFAEDYPMPPVAEGDVVALLNAGRLSPGDELDHCLRPTGTALFLERSKPGARDPRVARSRVVRWRSAAQRPRRDRERLEQGDRPEHQSERVGLDRVHDHADDEVGRLDDLEGKPSAASSWPTKWATIRYSLMTSARSVRTTEIATRTDRAVRAEDDCSRREADGDRHESDLILGDRDDAVPDAGRKDRGTRPASRPPMMSLGSRVGCGRRLAEAAPPTMVARVERRSERRDPDTAIGRGEGRRWARHAADGRGSNAATISRAPPQL